MGTNRLIGCLTGLGLLLATGGGAWAADPAGGPTTADDFIRALTPAAPAAGGRIKTRGLALGTGDSAPAAPTPTPVQAVPAAASGTAAAVQPPASPPAAQAARPAPKISFQVEFEFNSATLSPKATAILDELGRALTSPELSGYRFQLTGHTDGVGNPKYNLDLSKRRANAVKDYLSRTFNVTSGRLQAIGRGSQQLLTPADPANDANRRVEIVNLGA